MNKIIIYMSFLITRERNDKDDDTNNVYNRTLQGDSDHVAITKVAVDVGGDRSRASTTTGDGVVNEGEKD